MNPREILGTGLFDLERAQQAPGWVREINGDHVPETEEYGIPSTVFRADAPFHPGRLWTFVTEGLDSGAYGHVLRSKGFFWLASRPNVTGLWSQAGAVARFEPSGARGAGDSQGQELVFIGTGLHVQLLQAALADCLLADGERLSDDPFPAWHPAVADTRHLPAATNGGRRGSVQACLPACALRGFAASARPIRRTPVLPRDAAKPWSGSAQSGTSSSR